eukprot:CAMPEP_0201717256 /NCGR_PEP_ID=MMETSP0593-20130828/3010_1 /ASSEMBLY_ACC=CAM_ASM_000672 /TAXON_ID=267983 /ORGANISM="Skeletonema japonicum, Strain CCMP2506" /LENGTH=825 /DNA_ID=CAMNT_0048207235 /DNA_START=180 /DNA_END=2657 /DNA_ORIENTATION=-
MMQTTSSRRIVQSKSSSESPSSPQVAYNKENNGSDSELFPQGAHLNDDTQKIARVKIKASASTVTKKVMTASELLAKQGWSSKQPKNDETTTISSFDMKYSSISPPEQRCPSARTITNQCFTTLDESVDGASLSSESFRIMEEMNTVYEASPMAPSYIKSPSKHSSIDEVDSVYNSSPIPSTYMNSPSKMSSAEEVNSVYESSPIVSEKIPVKQQQSMVPKKQMDASVWLEKSQPKVRSTKTRGVSSSTAKAYGASTNRSLSSAGASSKTKGRGGKYNKPGRRNSLSTPNSNRTNKGQPMALSVQREQQQRHKKSAEKDSNDTRTCLDKRTARLRYAKDFKMDVLQHRQEQPHLNNGTNHSDKAGSQIHDRSLNGVSIVVRKRPIFDYERNRGDYDVVSIDNTSAAIDTCIIDNCQMHPDMKTKLVKPLFFPAQACFDEHCSNDDIYRNIAEPLVHNTVKEGTVATLLLYGQTGCGKSYTMSGIEERAAKGIFQAIASLRASKDDGDNDGTNTSTSNDAGQVTLQFVELCGNKEIKDLLCARSKEVVKLLEDEDGICRLLNAKSIDITSPQHLLQKIAEGKSRRATEATDKNGVSSRSHACCQIRIKGSKGVLTLIDLAGSERRGDSLYHSHERQKESAEINASLFALKECVRARASNSSRVPFRNHNLTKLLRESFERDGARLCVIAAVSPNATDTEHSVETLRFATAIVGTDSHVREGETRIAVPAMKTFESRDILSPKQWDNTQLKRFLAHKKMDRVKLTDKHDGKVLMKMSVQQMRTQLFDDKDSELAKRLFDLLRLENDKISKLQRADRIKLAKARKGQS